MDETMIKRRVLTKWISALLLGILATACGARTPAPPPPGLIIPPDNPTPALQQGMVSEFLTQIVPDTGASSAQVAQEPAAISRETWLTIAWRSNRLVIWSRTMDIPGKLPRGR